MEAIREAIDRLVRDEGVDEALSQRVAAEILAGEATAAQIGSFLTALRIRGEEPHHLMSFARTMREHATAVDLPDRETLVDTCGTGGDHSGTFNISTAAAIVAVGAGARVAKHGNRAVTGRCGSADVLQALGVNVEAAPEVVAECLNKSGLAFFFAPTFHGAMRHAGPARREIAIRTIFNMLGPMANPAGASRQLIGVYDERLTEVFARVLSDLGARHVMVVHGDDGLDEITLTGRTHVCETRDGELTSYTIEPEMFGYKKARIDDLAGGDAQENARTIRDILDGKKGPKREVVELNAAAALVVGGLAQDIAEGLALARESIDSGRALAALNELIRISNGGEALP